MIKKICFGLAAIIILFLGYVITMPAEFKYERSGVIHAPAEKIFPYISDFRKGELWSPYEKLDPTMKKTFSGPATGEGSVMEFVGSSDAGSGRLEILRVIPSSLVEIRLDMIEPFSASNIVQYRLTPEQDGTRFTWSMSGENNFFGKLMTVLIDCDKMIGDQFSEGIQNLKTVVEAQ